MALANLHYINVLNNNNNDDDNNDVVLVADVQLPQSLAGRHLEVARLSIQLRVAVHLCPPHRSLP